MAGRESKKLALPYFAEHGFIVQQQQPPIVQDLFLARLSAHRSSAGLLTYLQQGGHCNRLSTTSMSLVENLNSRSSHKQETRHSVRMT